MALLLSVNVTDSISMDLEVKIAYHDIQATQFFLLDLAERTRLFLQCCVVCTLQKLNSFGTKLPNSVPQRV